MIDRQAIFGGTEAPPEALMLDEQRLSAFLAERLPEASGPLHIEKFKGGQSNPTYRIEARDKVFVLRRRPPGKLVKSAHAIDREFRVLRAADKAGLKVPKPYLFCEDESIIGSSFYLVEYVGGRVFWNSDLPGVTPSDRASIYDDMIHFLAGLHDIDPVDLQLGDLNRGDRYLERNLRRWAGIYEQSRLVDIPEMEVLVRGLEMHMPSDTEEVMLHGDYGLYNIIVHAERPEVAAVLDWEMATLGDPLVDLAHHLRAWWDIPDPEGGATSSLSGLDLESLGIPTMDTYLARYFAIRGKSVPANFAYYLAFAQFRYAAMIQGVLKRAAIGTAASRTVLHRQDRVVEITKMALRTLETL
jgi:aminoglycoside phosphotransferase (APT) family kinase protein